MLNFLPKIRLGMLINVMLRKKTCIESKLSYLNQHECNGSDSIG